MRFFTTAIHVMPVAISLDMQHESTIGTIEWRGPPAISEMEGFETNVNDF